MKNEAEFERICLCQYMLTKANENGYSIEEIAAETGKTVKYLQDIFDGKISPKLDELILIGNTVGMKVTISYSFPFGHQRLINATNPDKLTIHS